MHIFVIFFLSLLLGKKKKKKKTTHMFKLSLLLWAALMLLWSPQKLCGTQAHYW